LKDYKNFKNVASR